MTENGTGLAEGTSCKARPDRSSTIQETTSGTDTPDKKPSQATAVARERLPDRRGSEVFQFEHSGVGYTATISRFADGRLAEIFIDHSRPNSQLAEHANDCAVLVSLLLQHGVTAAAIKHSVHGAVATALKQVERDQ